MRNIWVFVFVLLILPPVCGQQSGLRFVQLTYYSMIGTWEEAQSFCRSRNTDLVTIRSDLENQIDFGFDYWIGLYRDNVTVPWKWSRGNETATFFNWARYEPQDDEHCGLRWIQTRFWLNDSCGKKHYFLCSDESLVLVKENKTWEEALEYCRSLEVVNSLNPTYDLVTLTSADDHNYARDRAQQATTDEVWTGLRYLGDDWFWVSGEAVSYQNIPKCPAVSCGVLEKKNQLLFGIRDCNQRRNFFCSKN
ncbi:macrophage mannose receptor 1-like [Nothobranchius furzeri]|uniref:Macrophage mannose receptor 1-like n=1 Tax=Nothobranchius furzeri TaxID=105023 RepID=A0A9D3BR88_NOTFU|nr:macrophage mannose receptor 1-like [Nothobranchius furzeri]